MVSVQQVADGPLTDRPAVASRHGSRRVSIYGIPHPTLCGASLTARTTLWRVLIVVSISSRIWEKRSRLVRIFGRGLREITGEDYPPTTMLVTHALTISSRPHLWVRRIGREPSVSVTLAVHFTQSSGGLGGRLLCYRGPCRVLRGRPWLGGVEAVVSLPGGIMDTLSPFRIPGAV